MRYLKILWIGLAVAGFFACGSAPQNEDTSLKVVSYNIRYSTADDGENAWELRKAATVEMIGAESPDLVGMQEVLAVQFDFLKEKLPDYGIAGVGRDDGVRDGEMMAVMFKKERFGKLAEGHFWLSETPEEVSLGWDGACNRMVTWLKLEDKTAGKEIYFFNTHLDHEGPVARTEGSNLVASRIKAITDGAPFVLTGDFNALPDDEVLAGIFNSFESARDKAAACDSKETFNGFGWSTGTQVIDHIYYRGLSPTLFRTLDGDYGAPYISDHYPVEAVFDYAE